jgi:hypothetical protein
MVLFLSIDEVDGNTVAISHHRSVGAGPVTTLREKVFCVLGANDYKHVPVHTQSFNPRHLTALTLKLRTYNPTTNTYVDYPATTTSTATPPVTTNSPKIGLWFKLVTDDC